MSELNAKFRYIQLCRSLRTYGVTFFLVKEKMKGRNRLVPRLLGITKESVMRVDENTKQVLKTWPLTTVRRWAASPNSFTLDFGDYSEAYYSVQTTEGETISQLIAGYIDIIIKKVWGWFVCHCIQYKLHRNKLSTNKLIKMMRRVPLANFKLEE